LGKYSAAVENHFNFASGKSFNEVAKRYGFGLFSAMKYSTGRTPDAVAKSMINGGDAIIVKVITFKYFSYVFNPSYHRII